MYIIKIKSSYLKYIIVANNEGLLFSFTIYSVNVNLSLIWIPGMTTKQNPNIVK